MKKNRVLALALAGALCAAALTGCGQGAASSASAPDVSASASVETAVEHEYTAADLEGIVTLDEFAVLRGSQNIDIPALAQYDEAVVTGIELKDAFDYETARSAKAILLVTVNKAALDTKIGVTGAEGAAEPLVIEMY